MQLTPPSHWKRKISSHVVSKPFHAFPEAISDHKVGPLLSMFGSNMFKPLQITTLLEILYFVWNTYMKVTSRLQTKKVTSNQNKSAVTFRTRSHFIHLHPPAVQLRPRDEPETLNRGPRTPEDHELNWPSEEPDRQEYRQLKRKFLVETAEIPETLISLAWAGGRIFTQPAGLGIWWYMEK